MPATSSQFTSLQQALISSKWMVHLLRSLTWTSTLYPQTCKSNRSTSSICPDLIGKTESSTPSKGRRKSCQGRLYLEASTMWLGKIMKIQVHF